MSTRAIQFLKHKKIAFEVVRYEHQEKGAEYAAKATGYPLAQTVKTLMVDLGEKEYTLVLMPGDKQLSMKLWPRSAVSNERSWQTPKQLND
jgi:prolyl-tRNA editing enzyme YbaK/EbsC (Cys-tRNA(Pro) deacylase)